MRLQYLTIFFLFLVFTGKCQTINKILAKEAYDIVNSRDTIESRLIDGRSAEMFAEKHIEGAVNIDAFKDSLNTDLIPFLSVNTIIVYCTNHRRAEVIIERLIDLGYSGEIVFLKDGINAWISEGFNIFSSKKIDYE